MFRPRALAFLAFLALLALLGLCPPLVQAEVKAPSSPVDPVFPPAADGLVFVEGEDAVSTNMATEPTLNYGASGNRALQLSRKGQGAGPGSSPFFAEYAVFIEKEDNYELWYGGLPPGPKDEFSVSLASPVGIAVDEAPARVLYREDVNVVEQYAPDYYWVRTLTLPLSAGSHIIRFEISERRRLDDSYLFYLDAFFLATGDSLKAGSAAARPRIFPHKPADRSIDQTFRPIDEYKAALQANPGAVRAYIELSTVYSLAGDYVNSLKTLARAAVIAPKDATIRFLIAKNRIWRGDIAEGLAAYRAYLGLERANRSGFEEAGKVAAWNGRYAESLDFYRDGLSAFPGDLSLTVNLGLAELWASDTAAAKATFAQVEALALGQAEDSLELASIYRSNGYPDRAIALYEKAIGAYPDRLSFYLEEIEAWSAMGKSAEADTVLARIASAFVSSDRLSELLSNFALERELKAKRIATFEERVKARPDDLALRTELARVYFWNGLKAKAVDELESILAVRFVRALDDSDRAAADIVSVGTLASALRAEAEARSQVLATLAAEAQAKGAAAAAAEAALADWNRRQAASAASGKGGLVQADGETLAARLEDAYRALREALQALRDANLAAGALAERSKGLTADFGPMAERERAAHENYTKLVAASHWTWDTREAVAGLSSVAARGEDLAGFAAARIIAVSGDTKSALAALASPDGLSLASRRDSAELSIRSRADYRYARDRATAALQEGGSLIPELAAAGKELSLLQVRAPALAAWPEDPPAEGEALPGQARNEYFAVLRNALREASADSLQARSLLRSSASEFAYLIQASQVLLNRRVERAWHSFEEEAAAEKAQLGAYYDDLGLEAKAAAQYRRALAVDPSNVQVMYALARADERTGDWASAISLLGRVVAGDPLFPEAAARHNSLAREHSLRVDGEASFAADSNRLVYRATSLASIPVSGVLSLEPSIQFSSVRDSNQGLPAYLAAQASLAVPYTLPSGALTLTPRALIIGTSANYAAPGSTTLSPGDFAHGLSLMTGGGARLDWRTSLVSARADYGWAPLPDTIDPSLTPLYAHALELSASSYLPMQAPMRYLAPRLYALGYWIPEEGNLLGTALAEVVPAIRLSDSPWSNLGLPLTALLEDSTKPKSSPYYAADAALTAKGGLRWQSVFPMSQGDSLSVMLQAQAGLYQTGSFSGAPVQSGYAQLIARLDLAVGDADYFLSLEASGTGKSMGGSPGYWSLSILGGLSAKQPRLLAP